MVHNDPVYNDRHMSESTGQRPAVMDVRIEHWAPGDYSCGFLGEMHCYLTVLHI